MATDTEIKTVEDRVKELEREKNRADIDYKRKQADHAQIQQEWQKKRQDVQKKAAEVEEKLNSLDSREKDLRDLKIAYDASVMESRRRRLKDELADLKAQISDLYAQQQVEEQPILKEMDALNDRLTKATKAATGEREYLDELRAAKDTSAPPEGSKRRAGAAARAKAAATDATGKDVSPADSEAAAPPA